MKRILLLATLAPLIASAQAPLEIKGRRIGEPRSELPAGFMCAVPGRNIGDEMCSGPKTTLAGAPMRMFAVVYKDGGIAAVTAGFSSSDFDLVADSLKEKYGPPSTSETQTVQNAMGAKFQNRIHVWARPDSRLSVTERSGRIDEAMLFLEHPGYSTKQNRTRPDDL